MSSVATAIRNSPRAASRLNSTETATVLTGVYEQDDSSEAGPSDASLRAHAHHSPTTTDLELRTYIQLLESQLNAHGGTLLPVNTPPLTEATKAKVLWKSFAAGATSAMVAGVVTHPIDVIKVRQQVFGMKDGFGVGSSWVASHRTTSFVGITRSLIQEEGIRGLFQGVTAGMLRQGIFYGTKFVLYEQIKQRTQDEQGNITFQTRVGCGLVAGVGGGLVGNPFDLAMVRMQTDGKLPQHARRDYKNSFAAIARIFRAGGV